MKKSQTLTASNNPVTEKFLEEKLKGFATKDDLANAHQELIQDISNLFYGKFEEDDKNWAKNERRWEKNDKNFERVLIGQDRILKELENMRDENNASTLHFERNDKSISSHEKRITALETAKN